MGIDVNPALRDRIDNLRGLNVTIAALAESETFDALEQIQTNFPRSTRRPVRTLDMSDLSKQDVIDWLRELLVQGDEQVIVIWPHYRAAVTLSSSDFLKYFDELWYPSADDVWVRDRSASWLLEIDHEENLLFFRS